MIVIIHYQPSIIIHGEELQRMIDESEKRVGAKVSEYESSDD